MAVACAAPRNALNRRILLNDCSVFNITCDLASLGLDLGALKVDIQKTLDVVGGEPTEQACEAELIKLTGDNTLVASATPLICRSFQTLVQHFHLTPDVTTTTAAPARRFILDNIVAFLASLGIDIGVLKADLQAALDVVGSNPTEQICEQELKKVAGGALATSAVPLVCNSFQALVQHFHLTPDVTTTAAVAPARRFLLDDAVHVAVNFAANLLGVDLNQLHEITQQAVNLIGSDPTEQICEQGMHSLLSTGILDQGVVPFCQSFQHIVKFFAVTPDA